MKMKAKWFIFVVATIAMFVPSIVLLQELYLAGIGFTAMMVLGATIFCLGWLGMLAAVAKSE